MGNELKIVAEPNQFSGIGLKTFTLQGEASSVVASLRAVVLREGTGAANQREFNIESVGDKKRWHRVIVAVDESLTGRKIKRSEAARVAQQILEIFGAAEIIDEPTVTASGREVTDKIRAILKGSKISYSSAVPEYDRDWFRAWLKGATEESRADEAKHDDPPGNAGETEEVGRLVHGEQEQGGVPSGGDRDDHNIPLPDDGREPARRIPPENPIRRGRPIIDLRSSRGNRR